MTPVPRARPKPPITYPVNTAWDGVTIPNDQRDWYLAVGSFDHNLNGEVTVYPPAQPGGQWTYALDADVTSATGTTGMSRSQRRSAECRSPTANLDAFI